VIPILRKSIFVCLFTVLFTAADPAFAGTKTWTGAVSNLWSVGGNWSGGVAPVNGDDLAFPQTTANENMVNDLVGLEIGSVSVAGPPAEFSFYTFGGNAITMSGGLSTVCCNAVVWNIPTTLGATQTFHAIGVKTFSNTIALAGHVLTLNAYPSTLSGSITGTSNVVVASGLNVTGSIDIAGYVTLDAGARLNSDGSVTASVLSMTTGTVLSGDGTVPPVTSDGTIRAGTASPVSNDDPHSLGILSMGDLNALGGGAIQFDLVTPAPGSGHDQLAVNGTVTLSNPVLQVSFPTLVPAPGSSFVLIDNDGTDAVSGTFAGRPEGAVFAVGGSSVQITYAGNTGNDVVVTVLTGPKSWTGAVNNLWSVGGNWNGGVAPANGDDLVFPQGTANQDMVNDLVGLSIGSVGVTEGSANYTFAGNAITISEGLTAFSQVVNWNLPTTLGASQTFLAGGNTLTFSNTIALAGNVLTLSAPSSVLSGSIGGTGNVVTGGLQVTGSIDIDGYVSLLAGSAMNVDGSVAASVLSMTSRTILSGDGTVPPVTSDGTIRAGNASPVSSGDPHSLGILTMGDLNALGSGAIQFDLVTTVPGSGHDQLAVHGTVTLSNPALQVSFPALVPAPGSSFVLIDNDGTDAVSGTFAGQPEGSAFSAGPTQLRISYTGGSGNDVVVTALHDTSTTLASSANPTVSGESFTLTAHVTSAGGIPGGTVSFEEGATVLGTAALDAAGDASLDIDLPAGSHSILARYLGAGIFAGSSSAPVTQNVNAGSSAVTITTNANPGALEIIIHVGPVAPAAGVPTGTVTIFIDGNAVTTGELDGSGNVTVTNSGCGALGCSGLVLGVELAADEPGVAFELDDLDELAVGETPVTRKPRSSSWGMYSGLTS
jgi:cytoskeletal protein CcmA (bactofilin family)